MAVMSIIRFGLIGILICSGGMNLFWMVQRRASAAESWGCLWLAAALLSAALAVSAFELRQITREWSVLAGLAGASGLTCTIAWFVHIYRQSLHNTTM